MGRALLLRARANCKDMPDSGKSPTAAAGDLLARVHVVLVGTTHPGNIGAAARAMKTMGLRRLVLVAPEHFPHAEATARASGADDLLAGAEVAVSLGQALAPCAWVVATSARARHIPWPELEVRAFAAEAIARAREAPVAVVFGREHSGLSNAELDRCHALLRLPTDPAFASLNLAAAVQVVAWELRMAAATGRAAPSHAPAAPGAAHVPVTQQDLDGFHAHLEQVLIEVGYLDPRAPKLLRRRLRRMFHRMAPERSELNILRGILSAVQRARRR